MCQIFLCMSHWHSPILPRKTTLILPTYPSSTCPDTTYLIQAKVFIALNESWWTYPLDCSGHVIQCEQRDVKENLMEDPKKILCLWLCVAWWATVHGVAKSQTQLSD